MQKSCITALNGRRGSCESGAKARALHTLARLRKAHGHLHVGRKGGVAGLRKRYRGCRPACGTTALQGAIAQAGVGRKGGWLRRQPSAAVKTMADKKGWTPCGFRPQAGRYREIGPQARRYRGSAWEALAQAGQASPQGPSSRRRKAMARQAKEASNPKHQSECFTHIRSQLTFWKT